MLLYVFATSFFLNFFFVSWILAMYWNHKKIKQDIIRTAHNNYDRLPWYVLHPGEVQGHDGDYHKISVAELAKLYNLPINRWVPVNPKLDKTDWRKYYGEQAIHLYPLPAGIEYRTYLIDVLQNGIRPDIIVSERSERQVNVMTDLRPNSLMAEYLLADNYLRVGTRVIAYDNQGKSLSADFIRVIGKRSVSQIDSKFGTGYPYTFSDKLPHNTVYLKIAPNKPHS